MQQRPLIIVMMVALILVACGSPTTPTSSQESTPSGNEPFIATPDTGLADDVGVDPSIPTIAPPTPFTLTTAELHQRLDPFSSESLCDLPCYVGLTPGRDSLLDTLVFYSQLGIGVNDFIPGDIEQVRSGTGYLGAWLNRTSDITEQEDQETPPPLVETYLENNLVSYVYVGWQYAPDYLTLPRVIDEMGQPDTINLGLNFDEDPARYVIVLIYQEKQSGFLFNGPTDGDDSARQVCYVPDEVLVTYLGVFTDDEVPMEGFSGAQFAFPLADSVGITVEEFTTQITSGACVSVPESIWSLWQE